MDYYLEITVLPNLEVSEAHVMSVLFQKLHAVFVAFTDKNIGCSFPDYSRVSVGARLRLHGTQAALSALIAQNGIKSLRDYIAISAIISIPTNVKYRAVKRVQAKSNVERLRRRSVAKGWLTEVESIEKIPSINEKKLKLPFVQLKSLSTKQVFRLFIEHGPLQDKPVQGSFNSYGLSSNATVPYF